MMDCNILEEITIDLDLSPKGNANSRSLKLSLTNKLLRQLKNDDNFNGSFVQVLNKHLKTTKLRESHNLEHKLYKVNNRACVGYRNTKGGNNRTKFDRKCNTLYLNQGDYMDCLTDTMDKRHGQLHIDNSSKRHQARIVKKLEKDIYHALDFVEEYGVFPKKLDCETFNGEQLSLVLDTEGSDEKLTYENLPEGRKKAVKEVLNICDSSFISDTSYHELALKFPQMPRKSHVTACREEMNAQFSVKRTPGMLPGSYLCFKDELTKDIKSLPDFYSGKTSDRRCIKVKISGDGAKVSRVSNFIVISYTFLNEISQSSLQQRVLAIVKCGENYSDIEKSLSPLFSEITKMNSENTLLIEDKEYELEIFIGGDMKFLQILLGLNSSIGTYACPWCKVSKDERGNISKPIDFYCSKEQARTLLKVGSWLRKVLV